MSATRSVSIHYRRPPDDVRVYDQRVVLDREDMVVTLSPPLELHEPMAVDGRIALEEGSRVVWFTFPGVWHDIGRFHRADGTPTGIYANMITPVRIEGPIWRTTDLFLDIWWPEGGSAGLLDEDELEEAIDRGHLDDRTASRARAEAQRILELAEEGAWPPPAVRDWTLARSLERLARAEDDGDR